MKFVAREHRRHRIEPAAPLLIVNRIPGILRDLGQAEAILAPALDRIVASMLADRTNAAAPDDPVLDAALELNPLLLSNLGELSAIEVTARRWYGLSEQPEKIT